MPNISDITQRCYFITFQHCEGSGRCSPALRGIRGTKFHGYEWGISHALHLARVLLCLKNLTENETTKEIIHKLIDTEPYDIYIYMYIHIIHVYIYMLIHSCSNCKIFPSLWTTKWKNTRAWVLWHCDLGVVRLNSNITRLCFTRSFLDQNNRH